jgi:NAD(P)-dependent dehydrogenase (short-subunit alcohol dehydrogenase family)
MAFDKHSTAEQVSEGIDLSGTHAIVTGASAGIGSETTRVLALRGAEVCMACRDLEKAAAVRDELIAGSDGAIPPARLRLARLDLASLASVRAFANEYLTSGRPLQLLVNNAGIMIPDLRRTEEGFESHFGVNHLGHFLLTRLLEERLLASAPARVVVVASEAMHFGSLGTELEDLSWERKRWSGIRAYGDSKQMNLLFAAELNRRLASRGVVANTLHPGVVKTELGRDQPWWMNVVGLVMLPFMKEVDRGAATTVLLATQPEYAERGGEYFGDCQPLARRPKLAGNEAVEGKLWKLSEQLVGL